MSKESGKPADAASGKWKNAFLSSGLPLEAEVAARIIRLGLHHDSEFSYTRYDEKGVPTDCSVDLRARGVAPYREENNFAAHLDFLIECKYRRDGKHWVFMPDENDADFSPASLNVVGSYPAFSTYRFDDTPLREVNCRIPTGFRGVELDEKETQADPSGIKRGLNQLRYALPFVVRECIFHNLFCHPVDAHPFFVTPILVTTASLWLLKPGVSVSDVRRCAKLEQIASCEPCLDVHASAADDFESHCRRVFAPSEIEPRIKTSIHRIFHRLKEKRKDWRNSPQGALASLASGLKANFHATFSQFLVCRADHLPHLLRRIEKGVVTSLKGAVLEIEPVSNSTASPINE